VTDTAMVFFRVVCIDVAPCRFHISKPGRLFIVPFEDLIDITLNSEYIMAIQTVFPCLMVPLTGKVAGDTDVIKIIGIVTDLTFSLDLFLGITFGKCHLPCFMGCRVTVCTG
jgi:hypothetical protein